MTLTPREKAKELVGKFRPYADREIQDSERNEIESAKYCAITCVEEIKKLTDPIFNFLDVTNNYWHEVIKEIEKL